ncbi:relaxase/mobilization nuclease domain-containing protein [Sphingobium sp. B11D3D]|uniref:relaxase/mobilization nuclease domain-containing protein n=1 Tax=Sphingobium sp. B11D3D TaxID=2940576 RepID=UPI0022256EBD|nr:relaxase/mobilization nuclease domain-containing protein [Sphingobium sp. B11D3D]MCW2368835.1 alkylated DNA nucleotide flippase Atl1/alkylhydroperoxidase family enzyme [Sphingobium sp. B11D3D]
MILKGSQRSGGKQLGLHLLKTEENEHVEIHEVRGFVADDVMGAMKEAYALSRGTKCTKYLFSVSLNPPADESVRAEVFERACDTIEKRLGLEGQPRMIVFHEKEGRRHAHAVWSRIDADSMTARPLPYFKRALNGIAKELYLENGWAMPDGFRDSRLRDPRNFTLDEWQQAKRAGVDPREVKGAIQQAWAMSDNGPAFARALEERGLFLAQGDRRGHVALTIDGDVFAVARMAGLKSKEVTAKLGDPKEFRSVGDTMRHIGETVAPRLTRYINEAKRIAHNAMKPLTERKEMMKEQHSQERKTLADKQRERHVSEQAERSGRLRKGVAGAWDILTGRYFKTRKRNEMEAAFGIERDRVQRHDLIAAQMKDRQSLQREIEQTRERHARQMLGLYQNAARYRRMTREGELTRDGSERGRERSAASRGLELGR